MPQTYDGIGTTYYGKRNLQGRNGICEFCGNQSRLLSYETRLWFVIFYIPAIPLGKKQILDYCPRCRRHRVASLAKWKQVEADTLLKAMQRAEANPRDPAAAIELHKAMVAFKRREDAVRLAEVMAGDFVDNFDVQMHLGNWQAFDGSLEKSRVYFAKALDIKPEDPGAKRMAALGCIDAGELDRASDLLRGMDAPGPEQAPGAIRALADAYQARGDHGKALAIYKTVLEMTPALVQNKELRKRIKISEKALGETKTSLPKLKRSYGILYVVLGLAAAAIVGVLGWNFYEARHQTLYIVNQLNAPVSVTIDDQMNYTVPERCRQRVGLGEGAHHAVIRQGGKEEDTVYFQMHKGFFERFSDRTVFVLNPGGAATLLWEEIVYRPTHGPNPSQNARPYCIHFGDKFFTIRDVDYAFQNAPHRLTTDEKTKNLTKTQLSVLELEPAAILGGFPEGTPPQELARFAEHQLRLNPDNADLLQLYMGLMAYTKQTDHCFEFLAGGLVKRPVLIEWHRMYQEVCVLTGREEAMKAEYEKMLAAAPGDSALLYLLGRVVPERKKAEQYYQQAIKADAKNAYPYFATAYHNATCGNFSDAENFAQDACRLKPNHLAMGELLYDIRFALGEYGKLEQQLREQQGKEPLNLNVQGKLLQVLTAAGLGALAQQAHDAYVQQVAEKAPDDQEQLVLQSQIALQYLKHDMNGLLASSGNLKQPGEIARESFVANIELGNPQEAEAALVAGGGDSSPIEALLMCLAWSRKGEGQKAAAWRIKAIKALRAGDSYEKLAAALLEKKDVEIDQLDDVMLSPRNKAVWLAAMADICMDKRADLLRYAEKLNTDTFFPHRFLQQTIAGMQQH